MTLQRKGRGGGRRRGEEGEDDSGKGKPNLLKTCLHSQIEEALKHTSDTFPLHLHRHDVQFNVARRALTWERPALF